MKLAEKVLGKMTEKKVVESKTAEIIKELKSTGFDGSNEEQIKSVELLKGLAVSDDSMAKSFLKELSKHIKMIEMESLEEDCFINEAELRKDLKYRFKRNSDGKFDLQFQSKMTGSWIHVRSFSDKAEGQKYLKDNMEK